MKKSTLTKWVGKLGMLFAATLLAFTAQAAEIFTASPASVMLDVGETVAVTLTNIAGRNVDLSTGVLNNLVDVYETEWYRVEYPNGHTILKGQTLTVNITGLKATAASQTLTIYRDNNNYSHIPVNVLGSVEFEGRTIKCLSAAATTNARGEPVFIFESGSGTLELPANALVDYLVVGGGGAGGQSSSNNEGQFGNSGNGGEVKAGEFAQLAGGTYAISVGAGGTGAGKGKAGNAGAESSLTGTSFSETAAGGAGGAATGNQAGSPETGTASDISGTGAVYGTGGATPTKPSTQVPSASGAPGTGNGGVGGGANYPAGAGGSGVVIVCVHTMKNRTAGAAQTVQVSRTITIPVDPRWGGDWTARLGGAALATVGQSDAGATVTGVALGETKVFVENGTDVFIYPVTVVKLRQTENVRLNPLEGETHLGAIMGEVISVSVSDPSVATAEVKDGLLHATALKGGSTQIVVETDLAVYTYSVMADQVIDKTVTLVHGASSGASYSYTFERVERIEGDGAGIVDIRQDGDTVTFTSIEPGVANVKVHCVVDGGKNSVLNYTLLVKVVDGRVEQMGDAYVMTTGPVETKRIGDELVLVYTNAAESGEFWIPAPYVATVDILAVGGGGGGASTTTFGQGGGGGGAGGFALVEGKKLSVGTFTVHVGAGGSAGASGNAGTAARGANGGVSLITNGVGYAYASAKGGGGGATVLDPFSSTGLNGGSGGGSVWYNGVCGSAGSGHSGQGTAGGAPEKSGLGGGGGGAGSVGGSAQTAVDAGCPGGAGKESAITGETVLYSQGGMGGRNDTQKLADAVTGFGFGGNGGNGGPGTAGADGMVVVRIRSLVRSIQVPIPTTNDIFRTDYVWKEGETFSGLVYDDTTEFRSPTDAHPYRWVDVIESVTGVVSTNCTLSATEIDPEDGDALKLGVGYHNLSIRLKPGYTWEDDGGDESYGQSGALSMRWSVTKEDTLAQAAIDIAKSVSWSDASNATVTITTYTTPESSAKRRDGVLVLGSLCHSHGFESNVFNQATKAIAEMSDVDYYWWYADATLQQHKDGVYRGNTNADGTAISGHLDKGETYEYPWQLLGNEHCIGGQHGCLLYFLDKLDQVRLAEQNGGKKYGYIVFSFDGTKLSDTGYQSQQAALLGTTLPHPHQAEIAAWLAENFYKEDSVIWLTADGEDGLSDGTKPGSGTSSLISILDPYVYLNGGTARSATVQYPDQEYWTIATTNKGQVTYNYDIYRNQVYYGNADEVAAFLKSKIKVKPYNMVLTDKIVSPEKGLTIKDVTIMACTNGVGRAASTNEADWVDLITWSRATGATTFPADPAGETWGIPEATLAVDTVSNVLRCAINGVDYGVWTRVKIDVEDDGRFRRSADAVFNEMTGQWEKNPNDGKAFAEMIGTDGVSMKIDGDAETQVPWSFQAYPVKVTVYNGDGSVDGLDATEASVGEGLGSTVYYRGHGGYRLSKIIVDGATVIEGAALADFPYAYSFNDINEPHEVEVFYEPFFGTVESAPVTNRYDGAAHLFDVKLEGWDASVSNEVRYARWEDRDDVTKYYTAEEFLERYGSLDSAYDPNEPTDVGDHEIAYRVFTLQKGYGKSWSEEGWVFVESTDWQAVGEKCGSDHSVITPAPLVVRPDYHKTIGADEPLPELGFNISGLIPGESLADVVGAEVTNGWYVTSTYELGMGEGQYPTWVVDGDGAPLVAGDPVLIDPALHVGNFGNYYLLPEKNFQAVVRIPLEIGDVPQGPGLDPEKPNMNTGVDPVIKMYDGVSTGLVVDVTSKFPGTDRTLEEGKDYTIEWAIGDLNDPATPPPGGITGEDEPTFLHAGTNVVWYYVHTTTDSEADGLYFAASNYQYVIITPRPLVIESATKTWSYDGTAHTAPSAGVVEGGLVNGDTLGTDGFASITNVGTNDNTFSYTITSGDPAFTGNAADDYDITVRTGTLAVTPAHYTIGEVPYDDPSNTPPYGKDPETGKPLSGVEDAIKVYDGIPTNIVVNVTVPDNPELYDIYYSYTTDGENRTEWTTELPLFTNVVDATVYFKVVPKGEAEGNYIPAENFARVIITPAPVTVKADDVTVFLGDDLPAAYTATTGELACREDEAIKDTLIDQHTETLATPDYTPSSPVGAYPIVFEDLPTVITQGNYVVTYVPGTLTVVESYLASSNIHGLLKISSPFESTIIPAPWKGYTRDGSPKLDIPVDRLVKPRNLTEGDMILQYANGGVYKAWTLERDDATGEGRWTPLNTVAQVPEIAGGSTNVVVQRYVKPTGGETQRRGYGLWLLRQNPKDAEGNVRPFYLYGQWMTGVETITVGGIDANDVGIEYKYSKYGIVHDTMLADPDCTRMSVINNHAWTGFDTNDTIVVNTDLRQSIYCFRRERAKRAGGGWYDGWWFYGRTADGGIGYRNDITTPPGVGFWYERRVKGDMTLTWEGAPQYMGEGRNLDVWLVDHADAGDGKTHLAFKLVGPCAPKTLDRTSIKKLFDAGAIRYLHATGETQAAGKDEMDRLSEDLVHNARPVPYLRNGDGVNTEEELAKGWIWVTIDATDGTNPKTARDGTGDTHGAGDLWRIVVGKGVWTTYTVRYLDNETNENLLPEKVVTDQLVGGTVVEDAAEIPGYTLVGDSTKSLKLQSDPENNEITFFYQVPKQTTTYIVRYLSTETKGELHEKKVVTDRSVDETVTEQAVDVENYTLVSVDTQSLKLSSNAENNEILFFYTPTPTTFIVRYGYYDDWDGEWKDIEAPEIGSGKAGETVKRTRKSFAGYNLSSSARVISITLDADPEKNVIRFVYVPVN